MEKCVVWKGNFDGYCNGNLVPKFTSANIALVDGEIKYDGEKTIYQCDRCHDLTTTL